MTDESKTEEGLAIIEQIENKIYLIRGLRVMLDSDLAGVYGVETKTLNRSVRRNLARFPEDFMFRLTEDEISAMRYQFGTASKRNVRFHPFAFTEHGAVMLATILNSPTAIAASLKVVRAFVHLRTILLVNENLAQKIEQLEQKFGEHDKKLNTVFVALKQLLTPAALDKRQIGFTAKEQIDSSKAAKKKAKK